MILVTGGAGFIGSVLAKELNKKGYKDLVIVDRLGTESKWMNLRHLAYNDFINADEFFTQERDDLFSNLEAIFHMGACSSTTQKNADYLMGNNYAFSKSIFQVAAHYNLPLIYASSAATYGDGELGYKDEHKISAKLLPLNPYGYSKKAFDDWALIQKEVPEKWFGVKFFNVYGPNEYHKADMRSIVHKSFGQIVESGKVNLFKSHKDNYKDGEQLRDFVYVADVARAMVEIFEKGKKEQSGLINMGTGKARSFLDLVKSVYSSLDKQPNINFIDMPLSIRNQYQYFTQAEMGKFHALIPNFKFHTLEEGIKDYVKNYLMKENSYY